MGVRGLTIQNIKSHLQVPLPVSDHYQIPQSFSFDHSRSQYIFSLFMLFFSFARGTGRSVSQVLKLLLLKCQAPHHFARKHLISMIFYLIRFQYFLMPCQVVLLYVLKHVLMFRASKILMDTDAVMLEMEVKLLGIPTEILIAVRLQFHI